MKMMLVSGLMLWSTAGFAYNETECTARINDSQQVRFKPEHLPHFLMVRDGVKLSVAGDSAEGILVEAEINDLAAPHSNETSQIVRIKGQQVPLVMGSESSIDVTYKMMNNPGSVKIKAHCTNTYGD